MKIIDFSFYNFRDERDLAAIDQSFWQLNDFITELTDGYCGVRGVNAGLRYPNTQQWLDNLISEKFLLDEIDSEILDNLISESERSIRDEIREKHLQKNINLTNSEIKAKITAAKEERSRHPLLKELSSSLDNSLIFLHKKYKKFTNTNGALGRARKGQAFLITINTNMIFHELLHVLGVDDHYCGDGTRPTTDCVLPMRCMMSFNPSSELCFTGRKHLLDILSEFNC